MHLARRILQIVFSGFLCTMVSCHVIISTESIDDTSQPDTETTQQHDNNNYEKASTLEGFIKLLGGDPRQVLSSMYGQNDGGKIIAKPDICSPRLTSVKLKYKLDQEGIIYYPVCTMVERCGGCPTTGGVKCVPTKTEVLNLSATESYYSYPNFGWAYKEIYVTVRRHLSCKVQCTLNEEKCGPKKLFAAAECLCYCPEYNLCLPPFVFDPETCNCSCGPINCCPERQTKPCRLVLNNNTCECDVTDRMYSKAGGSIPSSQQVVTNVQTTPPAATPNTTSTTSSANDPCAHYKCPPRTVKYVNNDGGCACRTQNVIPQN